MSIRQGRKWSDHAPLIPYGMTDFAAIRGEGQLYVDKTRFIRDLGPVR